MSEAGKRIPDIPLPPDPHFRREPLPECHPKTGEEDPHAPERIRALLASPSYLRADRDVAFLERDEARGLRLNLEYLKPELLLAEHGVKHTIVVFGSTRISEPDTARRRVERFELALQSRPNDPELRHKLKTARRILGNSHYYNVAREFGSLVAQSCTPQNSNGLVVMTGGGPGIMEAASRGCV